MRLVFISSVIATTVLRMTSAVKASTVAFIGVFLLFIDYYLKRLERLELFEPSAFQSFKPFESFHSYRAACVGVSSPRPLHLITFSARIRTSGGIVRPRALAVFKLINSSNFVGCSTGRSAG